MTHEHVRSWLGARRPERPAALEAQMARSLEACPGHVLAAAPTMTEAMGLLGLRSLASVAGREPDGPQLAMELLAADAFVTYAFEAAAEEAVGVQPLVTRLLHEAV